jgi:hypothetical protein
MFENFKRYMMIKFDMFDLRKLNNFLDFKVAQSNIKIFIS